MSVTSSKQKKKRKRNRQKKIYQKETCSDAETDTDLCSLLTRIVEICTETKDGQTAADDNQTRYSHEPGKHRAKEAESAGIATKATRKPRKYNRSKPVRLPPGILEQPPAEQIDLSADRANADDLSPTYPLQSSGSEHPQMRPAAVFSDETSLKFRETRKVPESLSQLTSVKGDMTSSGGAVTDHLTTIQNVEETETIIAWSRSVSKTGDLSPDYLQPRSVLHSDLTPCERQMADESDSVIAETQDGDDAVDDVKICPSNVRETEVQETCPADLGRTLTYDESQDMVGEQTKLVNISECLTADVFSVLSENSDELESGDPVNFTSEQNDGRLTDIIKPDPPPLLSLIHI